MIEIECQEMTGQDILRETYCLRSEVRCCVDRVLSSFAGQRDNERR